MKKYRLLKDLPNLKAGAIFEHRPYDRKHHDRGNIGCGCLILGWLDGNCQQGWCGNTYMFPGQLIRNEEWFKEIKDDSKIKQDLLKQIEKLQQKVNEL